MSDVFSCDTVVVGAGVVGLACGAALAREGHDVIVLESAAMFGSMTSSRNSEVIHAGIYYPTGSLKHRLCVEGREKLYPYLESHGVAHRRCGKLIVATSAAEDEKVEGVFAQAQANGVAGVSRLTRTQAQGMEPALNCTSAVLSAETGIVDSHGFMLALLGDLEDRGGVLATRAPVLGGQILDHGGFELEVGGEVGTRLRCRRLVNAAGLEATMLAARLAGGEPPPRLVLAKGSYYGCRTRPVFERLIYPAPVDGGLGVHVTLDLAGRMRFGPDVEWLDDADPAAVDYAVDPRRGESFYAAVRRYWPGLPDGALVPDYSGCRPKLSGPGEPAADFRIDGPAHHRHAGLVHLFGIESPGLTSALAIADRVATELR
jgi:L-2-hydroxyglutarate oxidase LhgO